MATTTRIEKRQRGFFGWIFLILFWAFNAIMLLWMIGGIMATSDLAATTTNDAERAGAAIGSAIGFGMILMLWVIGAGLLGLFVMMTRGKKVIVETSN
jgi:hypothetical protein